MACAVYLKRHLQHRQCTPAALQSVLDYHSTVFKMCVFLLCMQLLLLLKASLTSQAVMKRGQSAAARITRDTHTNKHVSHTCNCLHFSA